MMTHHQNTVHTATPAAPNDFDTVNPGENWFFYWKTSASLWKYKMGAINGDTIIAPINYAFHFDESRTDYRFTDFKPEADLKKMTRFGYELGKEVVFALPLAPAPFLANGGIPHLAARYTAKLKNGLTQAVIDAQGSVHKLYSFFDTKVFQEFQKFCHRLGHYMSAHQIETNIYGFECGYLDREEFHSYLDDASEAFERAFARCVKKTDGQVCKREDFLALTLELYTQTASDNLGSSWMGTKRIAFLGGAPDDIFRRLNDNEQTNHSRHLLTALNKNILPSSVLLCKDSKHPSLDVQLKDLISQHYIRYTLDMCDYQDNGIEFLPLTLFDLYTQDDSSIWKTSFLIDILDQKFKWLYRTGKCEELAFHEKTNNERLIFFEGDRMDMKHFHSLLKMFLEGMHIVINQSGIPPDIMKKIESFFLENSLNIEKVNFHTLISYASLGESKMLLFDGAKLKSRKREERLIFWNRILSLFDISHIDMIEEEGIEFFWRTRVCKPTELRYEEIRRLNIYNPTSYKKRAKIKIPRSLALLKIVDKTHTNVKNQLSIVELELMPMGSIGIDFGLVS